jgi:hypothetical protein
VNGCEIRIFEERDEVGLGSLLERHDGRRLEAEVGLEVLRDLADEALEAVYGEREYGQLETWLVGGAGRTGACE